MAVGRALSMVLSPDEDPLFDDMGDLSEMLPEEVLYPL